jgi:hypothetical protein
MSRETEKWLGAALGFGAGIVWVAAGAGAALVCMLGAGLCAGAVIAREAGLVGWVAATATGVRKRIEARIPAERPPRTIGRKQTTAQPKAKPAQPKAAAAQPKAAAVQPKATQPKQPVQPKRRVETPVEAPVEAENPKKPYDHDEQSSEHVYEVATYGW